MKEKIGITWESIICNAPCHGVSSLAQHMATELPLCYPWDIIYPVQGTTVAGNRFESAHVQHAETQGCPFPLKCRAPWHCRAIPIIPGKSLFSPYDVTYAVTPCDSNKKGCGNVTAGGE